ncbi:MAG TPA: hypothetical protein VJM15_04830 [Sphingomicrobium sp.]|nr:hypothetical protein [Sphingomicrobium sp.]
MLANILRDRLSYAVLLALSVLGSSAVEAAKPKSTKPAAVSVSAEARQKWGLLADLAGTYWAAGKSIEHVHWITPGKTLAWDNIYESGATSRGTYSINDQGRLSATWTSGSRANVSVQPDKSVLVVGKGWDGKAVQLTISKTSDGRLSFQETVNNVAQDAKFSAPLARAAAQLTLRKWDQRAKTAFARFGGFASVVGAALHGIDGSVRISRGSVDATGNVSWGGATYHFTSAAGGTYKFKGGEGIFTVSGSELLLMPRNESQRGHSLRLKLHPTGALVRYYDRGNGEYMDSVFLTKAGLGNAAARRLAQDFQLASERRAQRTAAANAAAQLSASQQQYAQQMQEREWQRRQDEYERCLRDERNRIIGSGLGAIITGRPDAVAPAGTCRRPE